VIYVQRGSVKLSVFEAGTEATVEMFGPGDFVGEGCLAGQSVRIGTATAMEPTTALVIDKDEMYRVLHDEQVRSGRVVEHLLNRHIRVEEALLDRRFESSEKQLVRTLRLLARHDQRGDAQRVLLQMSPSELTELVGATQEHDRAVMHTLPRLSLYRQVQLGMTVAAAAARCGVPETALETVSTRPLLLQEFEWRPPFGPSILDPETVRQVLLDFCNGALFRIVVTYREERVEGLTEQDMVEAISPAYGQPTRPAGRLVTSGMSQGWTDTGRIMARWADERFSVNLFHTASPVTVGLIIFSKRVAPLAWAALDAPILIERGVARERRDAARTPQGALDEAGRAKAREVNKATFRV